MSAETVPADTCESCESWWLCPLPHGCPARPAKGEKTMRTSPEWLRERNNDGYGTPNRHPFWETQDCDQLDTFKVFKRDGSWWAYDTKWNAWYGFHDLAAVVAHITEYGSVDIHA